MKRKIAIVTSTRADWGLLSPLAKRLKERQEVDLSIIATNMHLDPKRGMTLREIENDGFEVARRVEMNVDDDSRLGAVKGMSRCMTEMADAFDEIEPDMVVILGDRYEMLGVASAATIMGIPVAHLCGGEITEGAIDDNIRHAITKLSSLHFATTDEHRNRIIAMGEQPERVVNAGSLGVYNIMNMRLMPKDELESSLGFNIGRPSLLVTYHPVTADKGDTAQRFGELLKALMRTDAQIIFTYPNNDPEGEVIIKMIDEFAGANAARVKVVPSMGRERYHSALRYVSAVVGNSSSGVIEVPSAGIPTVDIGTRQGGRTAAVSVIHCGDDADSIASAIGKALSPEMQSAAKQVVNPYFRENSAELIAERLATCDLTALLPKKFYDVKIL